MFIPETMVDELLEELNDAGDAIIEDTNNFVTYTFTYSNDIAGCMNDSACNYNPEATVDDGTCEYPEPNYDCDDMNDPPVLTPNGNQYIEEDNSLDVFLIASDSDGDYLT